MRIRKDPVPIEPNRKEARSDSTKPERYYLNLLKGQEEQLELYLLDLSLNIPVGEAKVDSRGVDVPMPQLLLKGV